MILAKAKHQSGEYTGKLSKQDLLRKFQVSFVGLFCGSLLWVSFVGLFWGSLFVGLVCGSLLVEGRLVCRSLLIHVRVHHLGEYTGKMNKHNLLRKFQVSFGGLFCESLLWSLLGFSFVGLF